jgi:DNA-directed RNA polymerase sigma subunit (sigma70/sigma32)
MIEYSNSQISALIDEYIHNERDRAILKRRLIDGKTFDELSDEFNISVRHIKTIVYKRQQSLFQRL